MNRVISDVESPAQPVVLVTGATSGIGRATVLELARRRTAVLLHGRTAATARQAAEEVRRLVPEATVDPVWGDLGVLDEVRALAARVAEGPRLDVIVHNAGIERWEREVTADGLEVTFVVNHLAPLLLTLLLAPLLERSRPTRLIFLSSIVHGWGVIHWEDLQAERWYAPEAVYYQSKLAAALTAQELARRLHPAGISVVLLPPGLTRTRFTRDFRGFPGWWAGVLGPRLFRTPGSVAREVCEVALAERFGSVSGAYVDRLVIGVPALRARVRADQVRMWEASCAMIGMPADILPPASNLPPLMLPRPGLRAWLAAVTVGELLGFTTTALVGFVGLTLGGHPESVAGRVVALVVMGLAGTIEGASLGFFQWRLLRRWLPDLSASAYVGSTAAVAAGGWLLGMSVPLVMTLTGAMEDAVRAPAPEPSMLTIVLFAAGFGAVAGAVFGVVQGRALAPHVRGVRSWILGNVGGWSLGLPCAYAAGSLGWAEMRWWHALGLSSAAGIAMGLFVALGTFLAMHRMASAKNGILLPTKRRS